MKRPGRWRRVILSSRRVSLVSGDRVREMGLVNWGYDGILPLELLWLCCVVNGVNGLVLAWWGRLGNAAGVPPVLASREREEESRDELGGNGGNGCGIIGEVVRQGGSGKLVCCREDRIMLKGKQKKNK